MPNLVLFASADPGSRANYARTVEAGVEQSVLSRHLSPSQAARLHHHFGSERVPTWGVWPSTTGRQLGKWKRVQAGDLVAFSRTGGLKAYATVVDKFQSPTLASELWEDKLKDGRRYPYELMFALDDVNEVSIDYSDLIATLPRWSAGASIREFNVVDHDNSHSARKLILGSARSAGRALVPVRIAVESAATSHYIAQQTRDDVLAIRREAELVGRFCRWLETQGHDYCRHKIPLPEGGNLFTDLFDEKLSQVIEAKSDVARPTIREALGQVLDYARLIDGASSRALLLPGRPAEDLVQLLLHYDVEVIFENGGTFVRVRPQQQA